MTIALIRDGAPLLTDIPGQLRQLADAIAAGDHGEITSAIVLLPRDNEYPDVFGWGAVDGDRHIVVQLELAKTFLLLHQTQRT